MPRPLSDSWQYFTLLDSDSGKSKKARCTFCGLEKAASITRLHQHLLFRCARIDPDIRGQLRQKEQEEDIQQEELKRQPQQIEPKQYYQQQGSPTSSTVRTDVLPDQAMLDWHLARALFSSNIPFESIEDPHMIEFFRQLQPNYTVPDSRRLKQYLLKEQHWDLINRYHEPPHSIMEHHNNRINASSSSTTRMSPEELEGNL
ncbi:hypothetical protein K501DRAFT_327811, partial [Backusella circina FSU 941]